MPHALQRGHNWRHRPDITFFQHSSIGFREMGSVLVHMRSWATKQPLLVATLAAVLCGIVGGLALRQLHLEKNGLEVLGEMDRHTVTG